MSEENKHRQTTFIVKITNDRKAHWRGKVTIAESGQAEAFQSALELIKIIDEEVEMSNLGEGKDKTKHYDKPINKIWEQVHAGEDGEHRLLSSTDDGSIQGYREEYKAD